MAALLALSLLGLAACGLEPVYGSGGMVRRAELATVRVAPIEDRAGQELRNRLLMTLGSDNGATPRYRLDVKLKEDQGAFAIQSNNTVTRYKLGLTANFSLTDLATQAPVYTASARSVGSYNVVTSKFAAASSEKDARSRAALDLADDIQELLIVYFSREKTAVKTAP